MSVSLCCTCLRVANVCSFVICAVFSVSCRDAVRAVHYIPLTEYHSNRTSYRTNRTEICSFWDHFQIAFESFLALCGLFSDRWTVDVKFEGGFFSAAVAVLVVAAVIVVAFFLEGAAKPNRLNQSK